MMTAEQLIAFEAVVADAFNAGKIRAPVHLSGGNEQKLIEIFRDVREQDWVLSTWRSHYHCLLKGVPLDQLLADINAGKSITLSYPEHRVLSSAIVGGILPIAVGLALAAKRAGRDECVYAFVGDMAALSGTFWEAVNYAERNALRVHFVVENNGLSVCTPTAEAWGASEPSSQIALTEYDYELGWPHSGAGQRVNF